MFIIFFYFIKNILCDYQFKLQDGQNFPKVKQLISGEYLIIVSNGIYIYNKDLSNIIKYYNFTPSQEIIVNEVSSIIISEFKEDNIIFILSSATKFAYILNNNSYDISAFDLNKD